MGKHPQLNEEQVKELKEAIYRNTSSSREIKRAQAILFLNKGRDIQDIQDMTGFSRAWIFELRRRYHRHGLAALTDKSKGRPEELLTKRQRDELVDTVKTKIPNDCDPYYNSDHWTTGLVGEYIKRTYNVQYKSKTSLYLIFRKAEFTYHKPGTVSERRNEQEVQKWRNEGKKRVAEAWTDPDTVILTEDEMHLSTQTTVQKIWLPKGEYPKIEVSRKRAARSIYGFLNIKTGVEHAFKTLWQNMYITAEIITKIRTLYPDKKILLLWDQAGWHKGKEAQRVIREDGNMDTLYFPTAAPDENPQEHVWKNGRAHTTHNRFMQNIDVGTDEFVSYLNTAKFPYSLLGFSPVS
jgi:transposase